MNDMNQEAHKVIVDSDEDPVLTMMSAEAPPLDPPASSNAPPVDTATINLFDELLEAMYGLQYRIEDAVALIGRAEAILRNGDKLPLDLSSSLAEAVYEVEVEVDYAHGQLGGSAARLDALLASDDGVDAMLDAQVPDDTGAER
jgi:hypothetical protein